VRKDNGVSASGDERAPEYDDGSGAEVEKEEGSEDDPGHLSTQVPLVGVWLAWLAADRGLVQPPFDRNARLPSKLTRFCPLYLLPQHSTLVKPDRAGKTTAVTRSIQTFTQALRAQDKEPRAGEEPREVDSCRLRDERQRPTLKSTSRETELVFERSKRITLCKPESHMRRSPLNLKSPASIFTPTQVFPNGLKRPPVVVPPDPPPSTTTFE
jgi:hypothetical protein